MVMANLEKITKRCLNRYENAFAVDRDGLISMMLGQSDRPILCFREIIQNSIDENSTYVDVVTQKDKLENRVFVSIEDDGQGMGKEKLERYLTLFDSTKEDLLETIGEMGVGKIFAFALNPEYLVIETGNGSEGYKIVFKGDMSGELLSIPSRKGTKITVVTKYDEEDEAESYVEDVHDCIKKNCCYVPVPIKVNGEKINKDFDFDTPHKVHFNYGSTRGVVALTGRSRFTLLKGGILLEEGYYLRSGEEENAIFDDLEILVDSFEFNQPLSRNAVQRDSSFEHVLSYVKTASMELLRDLINKYPKLEKKNNDETRKVRGYLHDILPLQGIDRLPLEIRALKLFQTAEGGYISYGDIMNTISKENTLYHSGMKKFNANELTYFTDRGIPVLCESHSILKKLFHDKYGCGVQHVGDGLMIEGLLDWTKKYECGFYEKTFLDLIFNLLWDLQRGVLKRSSRREVFSSRNTGWEGSSDGNSSFDWDKIKDVCFESFLDLNGKPSKSLTLYWWEDKGRLILNIHNPYVKSMIELSKIDPQLSNYYMLCEIASSKTVFPYVGHKTIENFTIELGRGLLENGKEKNNS